MIEILECTLRDASYPISYQFTAEDTAIIALGLHMAGFSRIEIGHGLGMGASGKKYGFAAATDEEYISAASSVLPARVFGLFAIPGIAQLSDIDLIAKYNGGFVRVGTDVTDTRIAEPFIKRAKDLGLEVSSNLMKTYSASVPEVVERSQQLQDWGADIVAVVDSAGGMMLESVRAYIAAMVAGGIKKVGFHGHNNLQLAVANTLVAIEAGAVIVDSTLRGLGRSTGNTQTEALVMCLKRLGYETGIDSYQMMDMSEKIIAPLARGRGSDNIEIVSGFSLFHSGYMPLIERISKEKKVDIRKLIIAVGDGNGKNINEASVCELANELINKNEKIVDNGSVKLAIDSFQKKFSYKKTEEINILSLARELNSISKKTGKTSVLTITKLTNIENVKSSVSYIRLTDNNIIGNIEIDLVDNIKSMIKEIDGEIDFILIDDSLNFDISKNDISNSKILYYSESSALIDALDAYISNLNQRISSIKYVISGINSISVSFAQHLMEKNVMVYLHDDNDQYLNNTIEVLNKRIQLFPSSSAVKVMKADDLQEYDGIIGFKVCMGFELNKLISKVKSSGFVIDAYISSFIDENIKEIRKNKLPFIRIDMRAGLASEVSLRIETFKLLRNVLGKNFVDEIPVVAGGVIGELGMVVIDSLTEPTKVIGIADGKGGLLSQSDELAYSKSMDTVRNYILMKRY